MLKLENITKIYKSDSLSQKALDNISISFRESEFVAILGPSGSGKTTLLNIIGGLDHYTSGDVIINGVSTKKFRDKDFDAYRNNEVGFIFQSYNLIEHQNVLKNVELALTLSGVKPNVRKRRALEMLKKVGLEKEALKMPNMLSGGQRQRVAIARALINNPKIILADEPTGALDSKTSVEIMKLLKEVSLDRLVIMVTHNEELADKYASRIVNILDGKIVKDTKPYNDDIKMTNRKFKKTSMSMLTSLYLSLNNLLTKKWRTLLTSFAGAIGIIGIALVLALSTSVKSYIDKTEEDTSSLYPITVGVNSLNLRNNIKSNINCKGVCTYDDITINRMPNDANTNTNLEDFKNKLDSNYKNINKYTSSIVYNYGINLYIYDKEYKNIVNPSNLISSNSENLTNVFLDKNKKDYKLIKGRYPTKYNELILILDKNNNISTTLLYALNLDSRENLNKELEKYKSDNKYKIKSKNISYDEILNKKLVLILNSNFYKKNGNTYINIRNNSSEVDKLIDEGLDLKIVGIAKSNDEELNSFIGIRDDLTKHIIDENNKSDIVKKQIENKNINILTGSKFIYGESFDNNLTLFGASQNPKTINIYAKDYSSKDKITKIIDEYNKTSRSKVNYSDTAKTIFSMLENMIDVISIVLIILVAISLVVSSIMISIITYISVLERTREIGILRALGARKKDIRRVFNAETIIEGFISGVMGVILGELLCMPASNLINKLTKLDVSVSLNLEYAIILVIISIVITLIAGAIPSRMASLKDPIKALRSE